VKDTKKRGDQKNSGRRVSLFGSRRQIRRDSVLVEDAERVAVAIGLTRSTGIGAVAGVVRIARLLTVIVVVAAPLNLVALLVGSRAVVVGSASLAARSELSAAILLEDAARIIRRATGAVGRLAAESQADTNGALLGLLSEAEGIETTSSGGSIGDPLAVESAPEGDAGSARDRISVLVFLYALSLALDDVFAVRSRAIAIAGACVVEAAHVVRADGLTRLQNRLVADFTRVALGRIRATGRALRPDNDFVRAAVQTRSELRIAVSSALGAGQICVEVRLRLLGAVAEAVVEAGLVLTGLSTTENLGAGVGPGGRPAVISGVRASVVGGIGAGVAAVTRTHADALGATLERCAALTVLAVVLASTLGQALSVEGNLAGRAILAVAVISVVAASTTTQEAPGGHREAAD
jgi:hypothetical protein